MNRRAPAVLRMAAPNRSGGGFSLARPATRQYAVRAWRGGGRMSPDESADRAEADPGLRLNLCPPSGADGWRDFRHREAFLQMLRAELWRDGLRWEIEE